MKKLYGSFGTDDLDLCKSLSSHVLENPLLDGLGATKASAELLDLKTDWSSPMLDDSPSKPVIRGPTDKQIESRTKDGRRRITPVYIPLSSAVVTP